MIDNMILKHTRHLLQRCQWLTLKCMCQWLFSLLLPNTSQKHLLQIEVYFPSWFQYYKSIMLVKISLSAHVIGILHVTYSHLDGSQCTTGLEAKGYIIFKAHQPSTSARHPPSNQIIHPPRTALSTARWKLCSNSRACECFILKTFTEG